MAVAFGKVDDNRSGGSSNGRHVVDQQMSIEADGMLSWDIRREWAVGNKILQSAFIKSESCLRDSRHCCLEISPGSGPISTHNNPKRPCR